MLQSNSTTEDRMHSKGLSRACKHGLALKAVFRCVHDQIESMRSPRREKVKSILSFAASTFPRSISSRS